MKLQNNINNDIRFLAKSEIRLELLNELNKNPNNVKELTKKTRFTYSSVTNNISKLEKHNHIIKIKNKYYLTPMTKIYFKTLIEFKNSIEMINEYNSLWDKHDLNRLSLNSIKQINALKDAKLVEATPIDIYKTHNTIKKQLIQSKNVKAIFPYLHPEYPKIIEFILKNGGSVELILPQTIFKELIFQINYEIRKKAVKEGKLKIFKFKKDLNLYLTVGDESMSLGLFKNDGSFDQNRILISDNVNSNIWADELFEHIKKQVIK